MAVVRSTLTMLRHEIRQVGIFAHALTPEEISLHWESRGVLSLVVAGIGYVAFVPPADTCESAAQYPASYILTFTASMKARDLCVLDRAQLDVLLPLLTVGQYHVCITRDFPTPAYQNASWLPTGVTLRIQVCVRDEVAATSASVLCRSPYLLCIRVVIFIAR